jgi:hypothetical protein
MRGRDVLMAFRSKRVMCLNVRDSQSLLIENQTALVINKLDGRAYQTILLIIKIKMDVFEWILKFMLGKIGRKKQPGVK